METLQDCARPARQGPQVNGRGQMRHKIFSAVSARTTLGEMVRVCVSFILVGKWHDVCYGQCIVLFTVSRPPNTVTGDDVRACE